MKFQIFPLTALPEFILRIKRQFRMQFPPTTTHSRVHSRWQTSNDELPWYTIY